MTRPEDRTSRPPEGARKVVTSRRLGARTPVIIDAVAVKASDGTPEPEAKPVELDEQAAARSAAGEAPVKVAAASFLVRADRHAFTIASLTLSLGIGWLIGVSAFGDDRSMRQLAEGLEKVGRRVETLAARLPDAQAGSQDLAALKAEVSSLKSALDVTRTRTADAVGQVKERLARAQREVAPQIETALQRLDRVEQRIDRQAIPSASVADESATIFRPVAAQRVTVDLRPASAVAAPAAHSNLPDLLPDSARAAIPPRGYVLRTVKNGIAYLETRDGIRAVEPGQTLPGAGRVKSIEKRGADWVVVTSKGVIDTDLY